MEEFPAAAHTTLTGPVRQRISLSEHKWVNFSERYSPRQERAPENLPSE